MNGGSWDGVFDSNSRYCSHEITVLRIQVSIPLSQMQSIIDTSMTESAEKRDCCYSNVCECTFKKCTSDVQFFKVIQLVLFLEFEEILPFGFQLDG